MLLALAHRHYWIMHGERLSISLSDTLFQTCAAFQNISVTLTFKRCTITALPSHRCSSCNRLERREPDSLMSISQYRTWPKTLWDERAENAMNRRSTPRTNRPPTHCGGSSFGTRQLLTFRRLFAVRIHSHAQELYLALAGLLAQPDAGSSHAAWIPVKSPIR